MVFPKRSADRSIDHYATFCFWPIAVGDWIFLSLRQLYKTVAICFSSYHFTPTFGFSLIFNSYQCLVYFHLLHLAFSGAFNVNRMFTMMPSFSTTTQPCKTFAHGSGTSPTSTTTKIYWVSISPLSRPVDEHGSRVTPTDLADHRMSHEFKAPCCLCASTLGGTSYTETVFHMEVTGEHRGRYVASCATNSCGYISKSSSIIQYAGLLIICLVVVERMYEKRGLLLMRYPRRGTLIAHDSLS